MKTALIVGVLLIVLGVISLAYQGITYKRDREVVRIGPLEASAETTKKIPLPPVLGVVALAGGTVLVVIASKKSPGR